MRMGGNGDSARGSTNKPQSSILFRNSVWDDLSNVYMWVVADVRVVAAPCDRETQPLVALLQRNQNVLVLVFAVSHLQKQTHVTVTANV